MIDIEAMIFFYVMLNVIIFWLSCLAWSNFSFVNPVVIYKNVPMNWFGVILLTILLHILLPTIAIPYWFYKLVTVGRKDEE